MLVFYTKDKNMLKRSCLKFIEEGFVVNQYVYCNKMMTYLAIICVNGSVLKVFPLKWIMQTPSEAAGRSTISWPPMGPCKSKAEAEIIERKETNLSDGPSVSTSPLEVAGGGFPSWAGCGRDGGRCPKAQEPYQSTGKTRMVFHNLFLLSLVFLYWTNKPGNMLFSCQCRRMKPGKLTKMTQLKQMWKFNILPIRHRTQTVLISTHKIFSCLRLQGNHVLIFSEQLLPESHYFISSISR